MGSLVQVFNLVKSRLQREQSRAEMWSDPSCLEEGDRGSMKDIRVYVNIKSEERVNDVNRKSKKEIKEIHQREVSEIRRPKSRITYLLFWSLRFSANPRLWRDVLLQIALLLIFHWAHFYLIWSYSLSSFVFFLLFSSSK